MSSQAEEGGGAVLASSGGTASSATARRASYGNRVAMLSPTSGGAAQVKWRWALLCFMCFQVFAGAGIIYGWPALESAMIDEHIYAGVCGPTTAPTQPHHVVCDAQLLKLNVMFVAASWGAQAGGLLGFLLDRIGIKGTVVASSIAVAVGAACFGLSGARGFGIDLRVPALTLMGLAGNGIYLAAQSLGDLFPDHTQFALFAISACFAPGTLVFLFVHALDSAHVATLKACFLAYAAFQLLLAVISAVVWPHRFHAAGIKRILTGKPPQPSPVQPRPQPHVAGDDAFTAVYATPGKPGGRPDVPATFVRLPPTSGAAAGGPSPGAPVAHATTDRPTDAGSQCAAAGHAPLLGADAAVPAAVPFCVQVRDARFIAQVIFFSVLMLPAQYFIGTAGSQIARVTSDQDTVNDYVRYFNLTYSLVSFITPVFGCITTRLGFGASFAFVNTMFILSFAVVTWAPSVAWFILADIFYTIARSLQFSTFFSYIGKEFGFANIGKLAGAGFLVSAMFSLLQSPLLHMVLGPLHGNYSYGNCIIMGTMALLYVYCIWVAIVASRSTRWFQWKQARRKSRIEQP